MGDFEILDHKTDLEIRAYGSTLEELFSNMLLAMSESQKAEKKEEETEKEIRVDSADLPSLLVDFLNEALYLSQVNKEVFERIKIEELSNRTIKGKLAGRRVSRFGEDIKAATYHNLRVEKKNREWQATVIFDI